MSDRIRKINESVRELASKAIAKLIDRDDFITVTAVETAPDLKQAIIWVSILGDEKTGFAHLSEHKSEIQHQITSNIYARYTPKIEFKMDHSGAHAARIEELLKND